MHTRLVILATLLAAAAWPAGADPPPTVKGIPDPLEWKTQPASWRQDGLYASPDGLSWKLVRVFALGAAPQLRVGFEAQSPVGESGTATFSEIRYEARRIDDVFAGN
jgi:hypothetical protein